MNITLNIAVNEETLSAINTLAEAIRTVNGSAVTGTPDSGSKTAPAKETKAASKPAAKTSADKGPFYWANYTTNEHGEAASKAAYDKLKAADDDVVRITKAKFDELEAAAAEETEETKSPKETKGAKGKAAAKDEPAEVTKTDLIETFTGFLPKDLDAETRAERREFVSTMLQRFGADKVSNLLEEHWAPAIDLVNRKLAGEDIDLSLASDMDDDLV